jgi:hypothetical protein
LLHGNTDEAEHDKTSQQPDMNPNPRGPSQAPLQKKKKHLTYKKMKTRLLAWLIASCITLA